MRTCSLILFCATLFCVSLLSAAEPPEIIALTSARGSYAARFQPVPFPAPLLARMRDTTWHAGCPVPLDELRLLDLSYWDFNGLPRQGQLIVHQDVAAEVAAIFQRLFEHGFLIERMRPVEEYGGSDDASMAANNTSSFNCRDITGNPGHFSNHSWGRAIDINPLTNPMLLHGKSLPPEGARFLDRGLASPGSILDGSFIVKLFRAQGWTWGAGFTNPDFQHFEKPLH